MRTDASTVTSRHDVDSARPRSPEPVIELDRVGRTFTGSDGGSIEALREVSLSIDRGEFVCLVGASGCGKSTLLRLMAGFEQPSAGSVSLSGAPVTGPGPDRAMVFQDYGLFPWLSVSDNIAYGPRERRLPRALVAETTERFTRLVGLEGVGDRYPHELSGGMQQRVAIARVLANNPAVMLMDEPFGALDSLTRQTMQAELRDICAQLKPTVVFVTHSVEEAVYLADRVVVVGGQPTSGVPGHVELVVEVPLEHPRDTTSADFNALKRPLLGAILGTG